MMQDIPAIQICGLRKSFGSLDVLRGIDLEIKTGSVFCLLGSNGAGKTTMVRILSTLLCADAGEVLVCGYNLQKNPRMVRKSISVTGQYAAVDELLTGWENMQLAGRLFHTRRIRERAGDLLERFELTEDAGRRAAGYSGGMRRKLDIAMSLMGNPRVLFLDEPTTGLDPQNRIAMWNQIKKLKNSGVTVFLTTQYLEEAEQLADRVAILDRGCVIAAGSVPELKNLLPRGAVALTFHSSQFNQAIKLLNSYPLHCDMDACCITVMTDGSVAALTRLLTALECGRLDAVSVVQKEPTLEEVFLSQINCREDAVS